MSDSQNNSEKKGVGTPVVLFFLLTVTALGCWLVYDWDQKSETQTQKRVVLTLVGASTVSGFSLLLFYWLQKWAGPCHKNVWAKYPVASLLFGTTVALFALDLSYRCSGVEDVVRVCGAILLTLLTIFIVLPRSQSTP